MSLPTTGVSIPKVQTTDRNVNQLQNNIINGIKKLQDQSFTMSYSGYALKTTGTALSSGGLNILSNAFAVYEKIADENNYFNPATGYFSAPLSGFLQIEATYRLQSAAFAVPNEFSILLLSNDIVTKFGTSGLAMGQSFAQATGTYSWGVQGAITIPYTAGDKVTATAYYSGSSSGILQTQFRENVITYKLFGGQ